MNKEDIKKINVYYIKEWIRFPTKRVEYVLVLVDIFVWQQQRGKLVGKIENCGFVEKVNTGNMNAH